MATTFTAFNPIADVIEDSAKPISFAQLKALAQGGNLTSVQAFDLTNISGTLTYRNAANNADVLVTSSTDISGGLWLTKAGLFNDAGTRLSFASTVITWTPAADANNVTNTNAPLVAFKAQPATAVGTASIIANSVAKDVTANVIAINDAPALTTLASFTDIHAAQPFAFDVAGLKAKAAANLTDVDNDVATQVTFKIDTIDLTKGDLYYAGVALNLFDPKTFDPNTATRVEDDTLITDEALVWIAKNGTVASATPVDGFTVTAWDGQAESATAPVGFVIANDAPIIDVSTVTAINGSDISDIRVSDANGDNVTVTLSVINGTIGIAEVASYLTAVGGTDSVAAVVANDTITLTNVTLEALNAQLANLSYTAATLGNPDDILTVEVVDVPAAGPIPAIPKVVQIQVGGDDNNPNVFDFVAGGSSETVAWAAGDEPIEIASKNAKDIDASRTGTTTTLKATTGYNSGVYVKDSADADKTLTITTAPGLLNADVIKFADGSSLQFNGTGNKAMLYGTAKIDHLIAGATGDNLFGYAGDDLLSGGAGRDALYGGLGGDVLEGRDGNDYLSGGEGNEFIVGGAGDDVMVGGAGGDIFDFGTGGIFGSANGNDIIIGFSSSEDHLRLFVVTVATKVLDGADTLVTLSDGGTIRLVGVDVVNTLVVENAV